MSWLSSFWHNDIEKPVGGAVTSVVNSVNSLFAKPPAQDTSAISDAIASQTAAITAQTDATKQATVSAAAAAAAALQQQQQAAKIAAAASVPVFDNESSRAAADDERRRLTLGSNWGIGLPSATGAPPVGYRLLAGQ